jgi:membrane fusion protein, multidrug efflux system
VTSDVKDGDLLIVDGLQSISDGMEVKTKTVTLDDNGVAHATEASAPQQPAAPAK